MVDFVKETKIKTGGRARQQRARNTILPCRRCKRATKAQILRYRFGARNKPPFCVIRNDSSISSAILKNYSSHLRVVRPYFCRSIVDFAQRLDLRVVPPDRVLALGGHVSQERDHVTFYVRLEEVGLALTYNEGFAK